ncbi:MAG: hypothetical protein IJZ45_09845 [Bacteroidaceae bacterium]|nr:hypothetical protein [Bacteroidaceae bacterium]
MLAPLSLYAFQKQKQSASLEPLMHMNNNMQEKAEIINVIGKLLNNNPIATPSLIRNVLGIVREFKKQLLTD